YLAGIHLEQQVGDLHVQDPARIAFRLRVHGNPVSALAQVEGSVAGVIDEQVVVPAQRLDEVVQGIERLLERSVQQQLRLEPISRTQQLGDRSGIVNRRLQRRKAAIEI